MSKVQYTIADLKALIAKSALPDDAVVCLHVDDEDDTYDRDDFTTEFFVSVSTSKSAPTPMLLLSNYNPIHIKGDVFEGQAITLS